LSAHGYLSVGAAAGIGAVGVGGLGVIRRVVELVRVLGANAAVGDALTDDAVIGPFASVVERET
jgi:hypothetical protein